MSAGEGAADVPGGIEADLRAALRDAMRSRDEVTVSAVRAALAAIDNAGAVDVADAPLRPAGAGDGDAGGSRGVLAGAVAGLGAAEVPRRDLDASVLTSLVEAESAARREAAREYEGLGRAQEAARLRAEADVLSGILRSRSP